MSRPLSSMMLAALAASSVACGPPPSDVPDAVAADDAAQTGDAPSGADASQAPVTCAVRSVRAVFPSPAWQTDRAITVPTDDLVGDRLRALEPGWAVDVARVEGFSRRPVLVLPLAVTPLVGDAPVIDPARIHFAGRGEGEAEMRALDVPASAIVSGDAVVIRPIDALPRDVDVVLVGVDADTDRTDVVPACGPDPTSPDPTYEAWRSLWPGGSSAAPELVVRLALARSGDALSALDLRLRATPVLAVGEAHGLLTGALPIEELPPETNAALRSPLVEGHLRLPDYRRGDDPMMIAADGAPVAAGTTEPGFLVVLPGAGSAPHPVVLFQHGGGQSPRELLHLAPALLEAGFAFVAIDLPEHGHRAPAGGGSDLSFLDFDHPIRTRENFRQAVADHLAVLTGLDALEASVTGVLALPPGTDLFDETRVFYMGLSLGGISGSLTSQASRELSGAALFVGGAGFPELLQYGLFTAPISRIVRSPAPLPWALLGAGTAALDGADPLAYAQQVDDLGRAPLSILQLHAIEDPLISDEASEQWARAFGATLVAPTHHAVPLLPVAPTPLVDSFSRDGARATRAYVQCPMNGVPLAERHGGLIRTAYAQALVAHCFVGLAAGDRCEVIDSGFAE